MRGYSPFLNILCCCFSFLLFFNLGIIPPAYSANPEPVLIATESSQTGFYNSRQITRTSSGRIYYFSGRTYPGGHVSVYSSATGNEWISVGSESDWSNYSGIGVAIDSHNIIHMITRDTSIRPYYRKFHTADSLNGNDTWEEPEFIEDTLSGGYGNCVIALDANNVPHVLYMLTESYKAKSYVTLHYANRIGGIWNKLTLIPKESRASASSTFDIAVGPDNIPYILAGTKMLRGNANNPTAFESKEVGNIRSFVIHQNGDVRVAGFSLSSTYAHFVYDHSQPWSTGWTLLDSGKQAYVYTLVLKEDVPFIFYVSNNFLLVQREFEDPVWAAVLPSGHKWQYLTTRWSYYNNFSPDKIDIGLVSHPTSLYTGYYWYAQYPPFLQTRFSAAPRRGAGPLSVQFSDDSYVPLNRSITSWEWDFDNDGFVDSRVQSPSFMYTTPGSYTVRLTTVDSAGQKDSAVHKDYITVGIDADGDSVFDEDDNCPDSANSDQTDLDQDGTGDACDSSIEPLHQATYSIAVRPETAYSANKSDVTALMKDGLLTQGIRIQKRTQKGKTVFDTLSLQINSDAISLASVTMRIYVSSLSGDLPQTVRIYPYNADGLSTQPSRYADFTLQPGWNTLNLTSMLHSMNGFGFVRFRLVGIQNYVDISEASMKVILSDPWTISVEPQNLDFGTIETVGTSLQNLTIKNINFGNLIINTIQRPSAPFSILTDECSGKSLSIESTCSVSFLFSPATAGAFSDAIIITSNDADNPVVTITLTGKSILPSTLSGSVTDAVTGLPVEGTSIRLHLLRTGQLNTGDYRHECGIALYTFSLTDIITVQTNDERKVLCQGIWDPNPTWKYNAAIFSVRNPYGMPDSVELLWNGVGGMKSYELLGQSFTPFKAGYFTSASLLLKRNMELGKTIWGNATVYLKSVLGGDRENILAVSDAIPLQNISDEALTWVTFPFSNPPLLATGQIYFIELHSYGGYRDYYYGLNEMPTIYWGFQNPNPYPGGRGFYRYESIWHNTLPYSISDWSFAFKADIDNQTNQQQTSVCCSSLYMHGSDTQQVDLSVFNLVENSWELISRGWHTLGYDDLTLEGTINRMMTDYYSSDKWMTFLVMNHSLNVPALATDLFKVNFESARLNMTDTAGGFIFYDLTQGEYTALFEKPGYFRETVRGTLNASRDHLLNIQLTPAPPATITGRITDMSSGQPLPGVTVKITDSFGIMLTTLSGSDGSYAISGINPGTYTAKYEKPGHISQSANSTISAGEVLTLDIQLELLFITISSPPDGSETRTLPLVVSGQMSSGTTVMVNGKPASMSQSNTFSVSINLSVGPNTVTATAIDSDGQSIAHTITVYYVPNGILRGKVKDAFTGLPVQSAAIWITDSKDSETSTYTGSSGSWSFSVYPGSYQMIISRSGYISQNFSGVISPGATTTVDAALMLEFGIVITEPQNGVTVPFSPVTIRGKVNSPTPVMVNGIAAAVSGNDFTTLLQLVKGLNNVTAETISHYGQRASHTITLVHNKITVSPASINFGSVTIGGTKSVKLSIKNISTEAFIVGGISATAPFTVLNDNCSRSTLMPSSSCSLTVKFIPSLPGTFTETVAIRLSDPDFPFTDLNITGTAVSYNGEAYQLPDTGQNQCFDGGGKMASCSSTTELSAQDGTYSINPPLFTVHSDGTVLDNNTGLLWQKEDDNIARTWFEAQNYCETLTLGGHADWRLPGKPELHTIADYGQYRPSIDRAVFPNTKDTLYWTSWVREGYEMSFAVDFSNGTILEFSTEEKGYARCVQGELPSQYTFNNGDGTATDFSTGLMWMQEEPETPSLSMDWLSALDYCEKASAANYSDWRLPNARELGTCPSSVCWYDSFWSSTTSLKNSADATTYGLAYILDNFYGYLLESDKSLQTRLVQCVRGGWGEVRGTITGIITDASTGLPLPSAVVSLTDSLHITQIAAADGDGRYTISGIPAGAFDGMMIKNGYESFPFSGTISLQQTLTINGNLHPIVPHMSTVIISAITTDSATVTWTTDIPTDSLVEYGTTPVYGASIVNPELSTTHTVTLTNLLPGTTYHIRITSTNAYGFSASSEDGTFATLEPPPPFNTVSLGDYGNVSVIEVSGSYDANNPDSSWNILPRQAITKELYKTHADAYDFIVIFSNFDFASAETNARGTYYGVRNDISGIGKQHYDNSFLYGSAGRLQGIIDMGNIASFGTNPFDPSFGETLKTLNHELMHRWGAFVKFKDYDGSISTALLGKDSSHWSFLLDTGASFLYGNDWKDNGNGSFTSMAKTQYFSPLDLYLMGFADKSQVPPFMLIHNPSLEPTSMPEVGTTISGTARQITIDDIIAAEGSRIPDISLSQKSFNTAFVLITRPGTFTGTEIEGIENIRGAWAEQFTVLTGGAGSLREPDRSHTITIHSPFDGDTIYKSSVMVRGTVNWTAEETGVTVNGVPAAVYGTQFIANVVHLTSGVNVITVTATDGAGNTATKSITVNAVTTSDYLRLVSNIESGVPPLEVLLRVDGSFSIVSSTIHVTPPPGNIEWLSSGTDEYRARLNSEGIYYFTVSAIGPDGITYQDTKAITVLNKMQMDNLLRQKWFQMKNYLVIQDVQKAVNYYLEETEQYYNDLYTAFYDELPQLANEMNDIRLIYIKGNTAKYRLRENELYGGKMETITYYIYFVMDKDGIWKIYRY